MPGTIYVSSGGQTGSILTIVSSGTGTITVSNTTLGKSYSKSVTAGGSAVFKGLQTGTWTVTLTDGTQTSTKTVVITSDYSTNIAYFSASINITYPATSTCVVTDSSGQTVASDSNATSSAKTWTATVNATGTYTVTATATDGSGKSKSETVSITATGQSKSVTLIYRYYLFDNGAIVPWKVGEYKQDWASCSVGTTITGTTKSGSTYNGWVIITEEMIDISGYSKLGINVTGTTFSANYFGVSTTDADEQAEWTRGDYAAYAEITTTGEIMCDISSVGNTSCRIGIGRDWWKMTASKLIVDKVWLE